MNLYLYHLAQQLTQYGIADAQAVQRYGIRLVGLVEHLRRRRRMDMEHALSRTRQEKKGHPQQDELEPRQEDSTDSRIQPCDKALRREPTQHAQGEGDV